MNSHPSYDENCSFTYCFLFNNRVESCYVRRAFAANETGNRRETRLIDQRHIPCQTSKMRFFTEIVNGFRITDQTQKLKSLMKLDE